MWDDTVSDSSPLISVQLPEEQPLVVCICTILWCHWTVLHVFMGPISLDHSWRNYVR